MISDISAKITQYETTISGFLKERELRISTPKLTITFRLRKKGMKTLDIAIEVRLRYKTQKVLGIVFDSFLHFSSHALYINQNLRNRNQVLKVLAGLNKKIIVTIYKAIAHSLLLPHSSVIYNVEVYKRPKTQIKAGWCYQPASTATENILFLAL